MYDFIFYFFTSLLLTYLLTYVLNIEFEDKTVHTKNYQQIDFNNLDDLVINEITKSDSEDENDAEEVQNKKEENVGLWDLATGKEQYLELMSRAKDPQQSLRGVSDGSVKDNQQGGTFAWAIIKEKARHGIQPMLEHGLQRKLPVLCK